MFSRSPVDALYPIVADRISLLARADAAPLVVGICGSQGSGKSTMATALVDGLHAVHGLRAVNFSLDDLYLSKSAREALGRTVHPLLATRGVPGTHDVTLGVTVLESLKNATAESVTSIPLFEKARDNPADLDRWPRYHGRPDVVIFEGWCVGARPQSADELQLPVNELESKEDPEGVWRAYANAQLAGHYQELFEKIDLLLMLDAGTFDHVFAWRRQQEESLAAFLQAEASEDPTARIMSDEQIARFIQHYERITRAILQEMPNRADIHILLSADREVCSFRDHAIPTSDTL